MGLCRLPRGEGGPRPALSPAGAGRVRGHSLISAPPQPSSPRWLPALCARTPLDPPTPTRSESAAGLCRDFSNNSLSQRLSGLGWAASARRHQARSPVDMFEAVEIDDPVFDAALAAKFRAQPSVAQPIPRRFFRISLGAPQFAHALRGDAHGQSITALRGLGRRRRSNPHPARSG